MNKTDAVQDGEGLGICPFCGSDRVAMDYPIGAAAAFVSCGACWADGPCKKTPDEAAAAWNSIARLFPCDGVWLVTSGGGSSVCISRVADVPDPVGLAALALHIDEIAVAVGTIREQTRETLRLTPPTARAEWMSPPPYAVATAIVTAIHATANHAPSRNAQLEST